MPSSDILVGTDIGTLGTKSIACSVDGKVLAEDYIGYEIVTPKPGWADFPMDKPLKAVCDTIKNVLAKGKIDPLNVRGLCISGLYGGSGVPVDEEMDEIRPCIPWLDTRAIKECDWAREKGLEKKVTDVTGNCIHPYWGWTKMLWIKNNEPKKWARIKYLLTPNAYAIHHLTGKVSLDYSSAGNYGGIWDIHKNAYAQDLMKDLGIPIHIFPPDVVKSAAVVGEIDAKGAMMCGLRKGTPVSAGGIDAPVEALSVGTFEVGEHTATIGTSMCHNIVQDRSSMKLSPLLINYPYVADDTNKIYTFGGAATAAAVINWFKEQFAKDKSFKELDDLAANIQPGSNGIVVLPYWNGERTPIWDPFARGTIVGLSLFHTAAHVYRACLEGVAFSLKDNLETAKNIGATLNDEMTLIGGGAKSNLWRQIFADITGFKMRHVSMSYGAPLGDVLLAGVGNKLFDYKEIKKWIQTADITVPNLEHAKKYDALFTLYRKIYQTEKDTFKQLYTMQ
ncbi:MAG: FGGY-family carbohydrate kinase [Candidatus Sigynarchaeota archaeon]